MTVSSFSAYSKFLKYSSHVHGHSLVSAGTQPGMSELGGVDSKVFAE